MSDRKTAGDKAFAARFVFCVAVAMVMLFLVTWAVGRLVIHFT